MYSQHSYTDNELFTLISEGDENAFEMLFNAYVPRVQPVILQIVKSESVVKDIVQDVFLRLWLNRVKLADIEQPKNYIFRIVYNQSFKYLQKLIVREKAASVFELEKSSVSMEHVLDMAEVRRMVETAIQALPPQSRQIYHMNRISGFKPQEISDELGISVQSVRNSLTRSGKTIREHLEKQGIVIPMVLLMLALQ
ncbi:RNA polymerase sigma-70 factor [Agriterribacter sp.]|uniref:RNA polymerase sigma factor n=1 Tax=Agriterribacter sp. TaxID=2821509 RepID=UPI002CF1535E|nr:RNA polymerase sigma-70 factor [Agriterribacter sp.]HRO45907.1 RNA polymerase sigma-70 factor [Agriterribacter sp.]HRO97266.1 RNA polymerase sigma-70 factor [Ferruginibacter sp.]